MKTSLISLSLALYFAASLPLAAQVKTDLGLGAPETPGNAAGANARVSGAEGGAAVKLTAPALISPSLAPLNGTPKVVVHASALTALPASTLPGEEGRRPQEFAVPKARAASEQAYFTQALASVGMPADIAGWLGDYQKTRHPGDQEKVYHGLKHSQDVPNATARVLEGPKAAALSRRQRVMLIAAAALHDIDPQRTPGTPARVSATLKYLDTDPESRALLAEIDRLYGITPAQIKTLIMATDFDLNAGSQAKLLADFDQAVLDHFPPGEQAWAREWGRRLSFVDKVASYLGTVAESDKIVRALSHEIRTSIEAVAGKPAANPTEAAMLAGSYKFQLPQRQSPDYDYLPADLKANFEMSLEHFHRLQAPAAAAPANEQAASRAPPEFEGARRYIRSIMGSQKPTEKQVNALLQDYMEQKGINPDSERGRTLRREIVPAQAQAEEKKLEGVDPKISHFGSLLLKLSAQYKTTPAAIEALIKTNDLTGILAGIKSRDQVERILHQLLTKDRLEKVVANYPQNRQGSLMREVASNMATPSGKSIEETSRDGVFVYVNFAGGTISEASSGRDPDPTYPHMIFYVQHQEGQWTISGYRQHVRGDFRGGSDRKFVGIFRNWLLSGGIPSQDIRE